MNGFVLAGTASGVGKTVATLVTVRALERDGWRVQPAKAGPDFIDPSHHTAVTGRPSRTLDCWLEGREGMRRNYHAGTGELCVIEGMMGLYDGDRSSTAAVADALELPVVLVVDGHAGMESVAATAYGFQQYARHTDLELDVAGIISQRTHGGRHESGIREALPEGLQYFGRIPPNDDLSIPERHLGLHTGEEAPLDSDALDEAAGYVDTDALADVAREPPVPDQPNHVDSVDGESKPRIAVARDSAFQFVYPAVLERLRSRGTVVTFAPVEGDDLPQCDGVYLPGGYPELHASELADSPALTTLARRASEGLPVLGECGGLMALSRELTTAEGTTHEMAAILPVTVEMCERYQALDHVEVRARRDTVTAAAGETLRGHEFHYSRASVDSDARFAFEMKRGTGIDGEHDGLEAYSVLGTYCHVHAESGAFDRFLEQASR